MEQTNVQYNSEEYTVEVFIDHSHGYAGFESQIGLSRFEGTQKWDAVDFRFHTGSEHTIDGKRFDLELQIWHTPYITQATVAEEVKTNEEANSGKKGKINEGGFKNSVLAVIFKVPEENDKDTVKLTDAQQVAFDAFFDDLAFDQVDHKAAKINLKDFSNNLDTTRRWAYKGSKTFPPCEQFVYWNVLRTVYPIKEKYVKAFQTKLDSQGV